jgi:hypothetical protein
MTLPSTRVINLRNPGEGVMRLERGTGHQIRAHDDTPQRASNNWCLRQVVIGTGCHHRATKKKPDNRPPRRRAWRARAQIKGLIIAAFRVTIASIRHSDRRSRKTA